MGQLLVMLIVPPAVGMVTYIIIRRLWERDENDTGEVVMRRGASCSGMDLRCSLDARGEALFSVNDEPLSVTNLNDYNGMRQHAEFYSSFLSSNLGRQSPAHERIANDQTAPQVGAAAYKD